MVGRARAGLPERADFSSQNLEEEEPPAGGRHRDGHRPHLGLEAPVGGNEGGQDCGGHQARPHGGLVGPDQGGDERNGEQEAPDRQNRVLPRLSLSGHQEPPGCVRFPYKLN